MQGTPLGTASHRTPTPLRTLSQTQEQGREPVGSLPVQPPFCPASPPACQPPKFSKLFFRKLQSHPWWLYPGLGFCITLVQTVRAQHRHAVVCRKFWQGQATYEQTLEIFQETDKAFVPLSKAFVVTILFLFLSMIPLLLISHP